MIELFRKRSGARRRPRAGTATFYRSLVNLFIWQGGNYLVPLIVTPYLARVLEPRAYGVLGLSLAVTIYGVIFADWGFNLSATQKVARSINNPDELRRLFWGTLVAKVLLSLLASVLLAVVVVAVPVLRSIWPTVLVSGLAVVATGFNVNWFLQGKQMMGGFAIASLIGRLLTIPLTLLLVHSPDDVVTAAAIQGGTQLISAGASLVLAARVARLRPALLEPHYALRQVRDGWHQFASSFATTFYVQANALFVGILAGPAQAGLLTGSQRISTAFQGLVVPINLATYPQVNRLVEENPSGAVRMMLRVLVGQSALSVCLGIVMFIATPYLVPLFLGQAFLPAVPVVRMLAPIPALAGIGNVLGINMLLPLGLKASYSMAIIAAGVVDVVALAVMAPRYGALGGAVCAVITEIFLVICMAGLLFRKRGTLVRMRAGDKLIGPDRP